MTANRTLSPTLTVHLIVKSRKTQYYKLTKSNMKILIYPRVKGRLVFLHLLSSKYLSDLVCCSDSFVVLFPGVFSAFEMG